MALDISVKERMKSLASELPEVRTIDADTVADAKGSIRFENLNAPEVQHITPDGLKLADWGGPFYTELYKRLWEEEGYDIPYRTDKKGHYDRALGGMENKNQRNFANKAVYEGVATPTNAVQQELYDIGVFQRAFKSDVSGDVDDDAWAQARDEIADYKSKTFVGFKKKAIDEKQLREYKDFYGESFSPFFGHDVRFRDYSRTIDNESKVDYGGGWMQGWQMLGENMNNAISWAGDMGGSQHIFDKGQIRAAESRYRLSNMPLIKNDFTKVKDFPSLIDWLQTSAGVATPWILGMIASATAGGIALASTPLTGPIGLAFGTALVWQVPMMWQYAGEVYGNMEGDMDQRNAAIAMGGGIAMTLLERLGLKGLMSAGNVLKKQGLEELAVIYAKKNNVAIEEARKKITDEAGKLTLGTIADMGTIASLQMSKALLAKETGKGFLKGATLEGMTEFGQESTGYFLGLYGTDKEIRPRVNWDEYKRISANAIAGGFALGGGIRTVSTVTKEVGGFKSLQRKLVRDQKIEDNWIGGTLEKNFDDMVYNTDAVKLDTEQQRRLENVNTEMDEEYDKGDEARTSKWRGGTKTIFTAIKEFPKLFTQKGPAYWENRILGSKTISEKGKKAFQILQTIAGGGKLSSMEGLDIFEQKRLLQSGFFAEIKMLQDKLYNLLGVGLQVSDKVYTGKTKEQANDFFIEYLEERASGKTIQQVSPKFSSYINELEELRKAIGGQEKGSNGITDRLYSVVAGLISNTGPQKKPFWFQKSKRLKKDVVLENKEEFLKTLQDNGWTEQQAVDLYDMIENGPVGYDVDQVAQLGFMNFPSRSLKSSKGVLEQVFGDNSKFLENDPFQRLMENTQEQVNYAVDRKYLGKDGTKYNQLLKILKDEMGADWDPRIASDFRDYVAASRGDYRRLKSKRLERMIGHVTFFNTFGHLDLSALASLPEAAIVLLGATQDKEIMPLIQKGVSEMSYKMRQEAGRNWSYINPKSGITREKYLRNLVDFYRYGYDTGAHGAIGQVGIDEAVYKTSKIKEAIMKAFFTANLLKVYTDATRVARLSLANDAIFGDLEIIAMFPPGHEGRSTGLFVDAFTRMRELNIDPDKAAMKYDGWVKLAKLHFMSKGENATPEALYEEIIKRDPEFMKTMDIARMSWVDNAIAHPTAMNRPVWYSNPAYRVFTQYNGFMSVFTAHLLPKIWKRIKGADPSAKYNAVAVATTMIALGFLSQMLKDEWRYDGKPGWITPKGYIQRGITSSGLIGTPEKLLAAVSPLYDMSKTWNESRMDNILRRTGHGITDLLGPTWAHGEQLGKIFFNYLEGNEQMTKFYLSKELPFWGKLKAAKDYNLGSNDKGITLEDALRNSTPSFRYPL